MKIGKRGVIANRTEEDFSRFNKVVVDKVVFRVVPAVPHLLESYKLSHSTHHCHREKRWDP